MMTLTGLGVIALNRTDTYHFVLIAYTTPLFPVMLSWLAFRTCLERAQTHALIVGPAGVALIY